MQEIMQQEEPEPHAAAQYPAAQQDGCIDWFDSHEVRVFEVYQTNSGFCYWLSSWFEVPQWRMLSDFVMTSTLPLFLHFVDACHIRSIPTSQVINILLVSGQACFWKFIQLSCLSYILNSGTRTSGVAFNSWYWCNVFWHVLTQWRG